MTAKTYSGVGRCIYCGSDGGKDGLRKEHIIPFSLGGKLVLPQASCHKHEKVTSALEGRCMRTMYGAIRIRTNLPTKRPRQRPTETTVSIEHGGDITNAVIPIDTALTIVPLVHFLIPGYLRNPQERVKGWTGHTLSSFTMAAKDQRAWGKLAEDKVTFEHSFDIDSLARTLAKIAHAYAVAEWGIDSFEHWLPPYILGDDPHLSFFIGGLPEWLDLPFQPQNVVWQMNSGIYHVPSGEWLVLVFIHLFAPYGQSPVMVIAGTTTEEFVKARLQVGL